ncbi:MAG: energy-coupling factor ABC transporter permease [Wenzhouxiangellaceae bacterium]|nr:energy-coupling factor ABC transporter permease [Wenzhouxiangellaceae bacterium]
MHIPDGMIAPQAYLVATALAVPAWAWGARCIRRDFDERCIPRLAVLTALAFVLQGIMLPLPGGSSAHLLGLGVLVLGVGLWPAFIAYSIVLALQAVLLGAGGITALPVNALAMGLAGGAVMALGHRLLAPRLAATRFEPLATVIPVWLGLVVAALAIALVLGVQPLLAVDAAGQPLFFPFGPAVTLPVIVIPHVLIGLLEGLLAWLVLTRLPLRVVPA